MGDEPEVRNAEDDIGGAVTIADDLVSSESVFVQFLRTGQTQVTACGEPNWEDGPYVLMPIDKLDAFLMVHCHERFLAAKEAKKAAKETI